LAEGRSYKTFDIVSKKFLFLHFGFGGWGGGLQPDSPPPLWVRPCDKYNFYVC